MLGDIVRHTDTHTDCDILMQCQSLRKGKASELEDDVQTTDC
jgi:hypothetical protein